MPTSRTPTAFETTDATAARAGPVLLATLDTPFDERATGIAVETAVESGLPLIIANVVQLPPLPMSVLLGYDQLEYPPELEKALSAPATLAGSLGVQVERLRVRSPRPIEALVELVAERRPGLLVFGPDRSRLSGRRYRRAAQKICDSAPCLVWLPD